jgi:hypothetical protein
VGRNDVRTPGGPRRQLGADPLLDVRIDPVRSIELALDSRAELVMPFGVVRRHLVVIPGQQLTRLAVGVGIILGRGALHETTGEVAGDQHLR